MIIKSYQFNITAEIIKKYKTLLLYGANEGVKKELIEKIKQENKKHCGKNHEIHN